MKRAVQAPITIKLRLGWSEGKPTFLKVARAAEQAGVDAVTLHPRSRAQRYRRPADWDKVAELVDALRIPVIGNGDVLTWQDAVRNQAHAACAAVMVGRWALAKPWIFREYSERRDLPKAPAERLAVVRRYVELCREHFGDDEKGRQRTRRFLVFHQDFFRRYRRGAGVDAVNSEDPRSWGEEPADELEDWLCRADLPAVSALARWLVDGDESATPPPFEPGAQRAVTLVALG
jgi:tRNA-dihydrouridine synthase 3